MEQKHVSKRRSRIRKFAVGLALLGSVLAVSGCRTISYYAQAARGQYQILAHQHAVDKLIADPGTPAGLRGRLEILRALRAFARTNLALPVDGHYEKYVDLHRPFVVWNVEAAPEFSMESRTWWYPLVGRLTYRGYFSLAGATNYAAYLRRKGYDVSVGGVEAYSTLGWFKDPILNTFVFNSDGDLAETIFHELAHQRIFAGGDTPFDEAFATAVGQEGALRWLERKGDIAGLRQYRSHLRRTREFAELVARSRLRLEAVYGDERSPEGKVRATSQKQSVPRPELRRQKQEVFDQMKQEYARLKAQWDGNTDYDAWFARPLNNAQLNSVTDYYDLAPGFEQLLALDGGNLVKFYASVERLAAKSKKERHELLRSLAKARLTRPASGPASPPGSARPRPATRAGSPPS